MSYNPKFQSRILEPNEEGFSRICQFTIPWQAPQDTPNHELLTSYEQGEALVQRSLEQVRSRYPDATIISSAVVKKEVDGIDHYNHLFTVDLLPND